MLDGDRALRNAAVLTFVRTDCPVKVFNLDHLVPTDQRMVVTEADPGRRLVRRINAEPAAAEYARILGKDPVQLDPLHLRRPSGRRAISAGATMSGPSSGWRRTAIWCSFRRSTRDWC